MSTSREFARTEGETHSFYVRIHRRDVLLDEWVITVVHIPTNTQRSTTSLKEVVRLMEQHLSSNDITAPEERRENG